VATSQLRKEPSEQGECGCLKVASPLKEGTLRVQATKSSPRFEVTADGDGVVGHAGAALLVELADRLGLTTAFSWRAGRAQTARYRHHVGGVLRDLAVLLADGGDCLSDLAGLREQPALFGEVASTATAWRVVEQVARDEDGLAGLRAARAQARAQAWTAGAHVEGLLVVDLDATLLDAHSDKQGAAGT
jgi:DDE family transposase